MTGEKAGIPAEGSAQARGVCVCVCVCGGGSKGCVCRSQCVDLEREASRCEACIPGSALPPSMFSFNRHPAASRKQGCPRN